MPSSRPLLKDCKLTKQVSTRHHNCPALSWAFIFLLDVSVLQPLYCQKLLSCVYCCLFGVCCVPGQQQRDNSCCHDGQRPLQNPEVGMLMAAASSYHSDQLTLHLLLLLGRCAVQALTNSIGAKTELRVCWVLAAGMGCNPGCWHASTGNKRLPYQSSSTTMLQAVLKPCTPVSQACLMPAPT